MSLLLKNGQVYYKDKLQNLDIFIENDQIKKVGKDIDDNVIVFNRPTIYSSPKVLLKKGRLCLIKRCKDQWCKIETDIYSGWVKSESLWGRL